MNPIRRRRLHVRVGKGLQERYQRQQKRDGRGPSGIGSGKSNPHVSAADLAFHFLEGGDHALSIEYSIEAAGEALDVFALETARERYSNALESALTLEDQEQAAHIERRLCIVNDEIGRVAEAARHGESALSRGVLDVADQMMVRSRVAISYMVTGDPRGVSVAKELIDQAQAESAPLFEAYGFVVVGRSDHHHGRLSAAIESFERALELAELDRSRRAQESPPDSSSSDGTSARTGARKEPALLNPSPEVANGLLSGHLYAMLAGSYQHLGDVPRSMEWARKSIELGKRTGDQMAECLGMEFLGEDCVGQGRFRDALRWSHDEIELATRIQARQRVAWAMSVQALSELYLGGAGDRRANVRRRAGTL